MRSICHMADMGDISDISDMKIKVLSSESWHPAAPMAYNVYKAYKAYTVGGAESQTIWEYSSSCLTKVQVTSSCNSLLDATHCNAVGVWNKMLQRCCLITFVATPCQLQDITRQLSVKKVRICCNIMSTSKYCNTVVCNNMLQFYRQLGFVAMIWHMHATYCNWAGLCLM